MLSSAGKPLDLGEKLPSFRDFHRRIWAGEVNLADNGRLWHGSLGAAATEYAAYTIEEALRIVSDRHTGPEGMRRLLPLA
jgi:hypothetical protein